MPTWRELEKFFSELEAPLKHGRIDYQGGAAGEYWRLAAVSNQNAERRFELYAQMAGRKLWTSKGNELGLSAALSDVERWYHWLRMSQFYQADRHGYQINADGTKGLVYGGTINDPAAASATLCLELSVMSPEEENKQQHSISINATGNAKVNFGSVDNSVNLSNSQIEIFERVKDSIVKAVPADSQKALLDELEKLKAAANTPSYSERYRSFIQVVGDHANILGTALAALGMLL